MSELPAESTITVAAKGKLSKLAAKRLVRFVTLFPKALVSDGPETIHDLRVASRRLQQVIELLLPKAKSSGTKKLCRTLRRVRRGCGPCRNLDVSIDLIKTRVEATPSASTRHAWEGVRLWLEERRAVAVETGRAELRKHNLVDFIERVQARLENAEEQPEAIGRLRERARGALAEWRSALDAARENRRVERIHAFRIAGKRLRYRAELLGELGNSSVKPIIAALKCLQDDLGHWHDHAVLREYVAEFIGRPGFLAEEPGMCRALLLEMEREKQRDHAMIDDIMSKAEKLAETCTETEVNDSPAADVQKDQ